ncbi:MAG: hypothetical protein KAW09_11120 [Thermoplasmata archaeon]|nr:hypothetical protein [Thermoplasmata archaeon]
MAHKRKGGKEVNIPPKKREKYTHGIRVLLAVILAAVLVLVPLAVVLTSNVEDNGENGPPPFEITFPRDEGQHDDSEEFWKLDLSLQNQGGDRFAINVDYYLHETGLPERVVTVTDEGNVYGDEFFLGIHEGSLQVGTEGLDLSFDSALGTDSWIGDYAIPYQYTYQGQVTDGINEIYNLDLTMTTVKDALLLGDEGIIYLESQGNALGTIKGYMFTRLSVTGTMAFAGSTHTVTGYAWTQHEWGAWALHNMEELRLHLTTASELYLTRFFNPQNEQIIKQLVYYSKPDGQVLELGSEDFQLEILRYWIDPRFMPSTVRCFPSSWRFVATTVNTDITFHSSTSDQLEKHHWEGSVPISGTIDGIVGTGRGFVLLNHPYHSQPEFVSFYRDDNIPTNPDLWANISNEIPMDNATIYYQINGGNWNSVMMTNVEGDLWKATISASDGADVKAYVEAYDLASKRIKSDDMDWTVTI